MTPAERLKEARTRLGISQEKVAKLAAVSQSTIGNLESGTRFEPKAVQMAKALGVTA
jgi:transcriptional regulator with XRE-family HTH domain